MSDGYTIKEMVQEVRQDNKTALQTQERILTTLEGIDGHLTRLNSKVATHESEIHKLKEDHTKVRAYATAISVVIGAVWTVANLVSRWI